VVQIPMERSLVRKGILFILVGPAGSGKNTLCTRLITEFSGSLRYSVSVTTRAPRPQEVDGESYKFVSRAEFEVLRARGEFFEWEEIHGNLYGTLRSSLLDGVEKGQDLLLQIDVRGAVSFKRAFPGNVVAAFVLPPSSAELRERMVRRTAIDEHELRRRFDTARIEYEELLRLGGEPGLIDYLVVNSDLDVAYDYIRAIVIAERARYHRMERGSVERFCEVDAAVSDPR
jgi:guanylate kinase